MKRRYFPYWEWEDFKAGMWKRDGFQNKEELLQKAIQFTGNAELYGKWMFMVIEDWPISCMQNLMDSGLNQKAWIGHAACCLAIGCPEFITRLAWKQLSDKQRDDANKQAENAISCWNLNKNKRKLCLGLIWKR